MLPNIPAICVYLATGVTDMRKSINGLSLLVAEHLELDPLSGHLFAFCNRKRDIVKKWPETGTELMPLGTRELHWLLEGLSLVQENAHQKLTFSTVV